MNRMTWTRFGLILSTMILALTLVACANSASPAALAGDATTSRSGAPATAPSAAPVQGEAAPAPDAPARLLTYTATIDIRVPVVAQGITEVEAIADRYGGFVANSRLSGGPEAPRATVTIRVPSEFFRAAMNDLRGTGERVLSESLSTEDVTDQYVDLEAQLRSLRATEEQYLELLRRAQTVEDTLKVQAQLLQVRTNIERIQGRLQGLDRRIEFSTITANLTQPGVALGRDGFDPGRVVREAWEGSLVVLQAMAEGLLRVVVFFWWLCIPVLLIGAVTLVLARRRGGRKPPPAN